MKYRICLIVAFLFLLGLQVFPSEIFYQAQVDVVYAIREAEQGTEIDFDVVPTQRTAYATAAKQFITETVRITSEATFQEFMKNLTEENGYLYYFPGEWYSTRLPKPYYEIRTFDQWQEMLQDLSNENIQRLAPGVFIHDKDFIGTDDSASWNRTVLIGIDHANTVLPRIEFMWRKENLGRYLRTGKLRLGKLGESQASADLEAFMNLEGENGIQVVVQEN